MLRIIIVSAGILAMAFLAYLIINARRGHLIARHLHMFGMIYNSDYEQTGSKEVALINAFRVFSTCPRLKSLTPNESRAAINVLMTAPSPKSLIDNIIMELDSKMMLKAFRDTTFLKQLVDTALRYQDKPITEQD